MSNPRTKAMQLVALALDRAATEGEARNAALAACRLIRDHDLLDENDSTPQMVAPPRVQRRVFPSKYRGYCAACMRIYAAGDLVAWARGEPTLHAECARREARAA